MKKILLMQSVAVMWGCTDYVGRWDDQYGTAFVEDSVPVARVCEEYATTTVTEGGCTSAYTCYNNTWTLVGRPYCFQSSSSDYFGISSSSLWRSSSSSVVARSSSSLTFSYSSSVVVKSSSSMKRSSSSSVVAKSSSSVKKSSSSSAIRSSSSKMNSSSSSRKVSTAFPTWLGSEGSVRVDTRLDAGAGTSGYWFVFNDNGDGGASKVVWTDGSEEMYPTSDVLDLCNGVCGTAVLYKGTLTYNPFVGVGFNVAGEKSSSKSTTVAADASTWGGICITYTSQSSSYLELGLGDFDADIGYANPAYNLPKSSNVATMKRLTWSDFKQPAWYKWDTKIDGPGAAKKLVSIKFKIQNAPGSFDFNICAIGPYDGDCPSSCE
ncbi:MAG: hypothetical protein SPL52_07930 [Fibrobacter sp.]|nr:hypothetical protein [Fibrobacter sp.]